jgi:hypothetical protein
MSSSASLFRFQIAGWKADSTLCAFGLSFSAPVRERLFRAKAQRQDVRREGLSSSFHLISSSIRDNYKLASKLNRAASQ